MIYYAWTACESLNGGRNYHLRKCRVPGISILELFDITVRLREGEQGGINTPPFKVKLINKKEKIGVLRSRWMNGGIV